MDVARAAVLVAMPADSLEPNDLLLAGLAANFNDGYAAGVPYLRQALATFGTAVAPERELRWLWPMSSAALHLWDDDHWVLLSTRYVTLARAAGSLSELPLALSTRAMVMLFAGAAQRRSLSRRGAGNRDRGHRRPSWRRTAGCSSPPCAESRRQTEGLIEHTHREAVAKGEGISIAVAEWTRAVLRNGLGNYVEAAAAAREALYHQEYPELRYPGIANWAAAELIEAASRSGMLDEARQAVEWISEMTSASGTSWALGVQARSRALVTDGDAAESAYREAISWLEQTEVGAELARTHLLYGEWLRRERRRTDARDHLRTAHQMLGAMGMQAFAERARHELLATGETARRRSAPDTQELTPQEALIAQLAREGLSNPEIGSRLFISARTAQYHLRKVFVKLDITSRSQLDTVLPAASTQVVTSGAGARSPRRST